MTDDTRFEEQFSVGSPAVLRVKNIRGPVIVEPHDEPSIHILAIRRDETGNAQRTLVSLTQDANGDVLASTDYEENFFGIGNPCEVHYTIRTPRNTHLRVRQVSGNTRAHGLAGKLKIKSVSGPIQVTDMEGELIIATVSGALEARALRGPLEVDSVSGRITVLESDLPEVLAKTVSGRMTVQTPLGAGPYKFTSVSGGVSLIVPAEQGCHVHGHTTSGQLRTDLPGTRGNHSRRSWELDLNGGGPEVRFKSVSGSLRILNQPDSDPRGIKFQPEEAVDRMAVLEKVRSGEISVEEALRSL